MLCTVCQALKINGARHMPGSVIELTAEQVALLPAGAVVPLAPELAEPEAESEPAVPVPSEPAPESVRVQQAPSRRPAKARVRKPE